MKKISIYIISKNYGDFVEEAIKSVLRQTYSGWELFLIDENSTDDTREIFKKYETIDNVFVLETPGIGLPAVGNLVTEKSNGDYIIRLDGDDIFDEHILTILSHYLDTYPDVALVFPDYYLIDSQGEIFSHETRPQIYRDDHSLDIPPNGACTLIRKSALLEVGGYREDLGAQDGLDLWIKMRDRYRVRNISLPLFYYRRHGDNLTNNAVKIATARRSLKKSAANRNSKPKVPITAVIPCRRHFDFTPDVWNIQLGGHTLLERDIMTCLRSEYIDKIVVACDNPDAARIVNQFDSERVRFYLRPEQSTLPSAQLSELLRHILQLYDPLYTGISIVRYLQTPFVTTETIDEAVCTLILSEADSVFAIEEIRSEVYQRKAFGLNLVNGPRGVHRGIERLYRNASTCVAHRAKNLFSGSIEGASRIGFPVSAAESFFISSSRDLQIAESLIKIPE